MTKDSTPETLKWKGSKVYRCRLCAFDTLDKAVFEDHFAKVHAPLQVIEGRKATARKEAEQKAVTTTEE